MKPLSQRGVCSLLFVVALFISAKICNQSKYPLINEWKKGNVTHTQTHPHRGMILSLTTGIHAIFSNIVGDYAKWIN
jgi:hypothetical protein